MKNNYFIIHGTYGNPYDHWFPWLKGKIEELGMECIVPKFSTVDNEDNYEFRRQVLKDYLDKGLINENTIFIGHSSGSIVAIKFILEEGIKVRGVISVAGFNNANCPYEDYNRINSAFFVEDDKLKELKNYVDFTYAIYSLNDPYISFEDDKKFAEMIDAEKCFIKDAGHLNTDTGYVKFNELLDIIKKVK